MRTQRGGHSTFLTWPSLSLHFDMSNVGLTKTHALGDRPAYDSSRTNTSDVGPLCFVECVCSIGGDWFSWIWTWLCSRLNQDTVCPPLRVLKARRTRKGGRYVMVSRNHFVRPGRFAEPVRLSIRTGLYGIPIPRPSLQLERTVFWSVQSSNVSANRFASG